MDEEAQQRQALVAAPPPNRRITGRRGIISTMGDIFDPAGQTSPDQRLSRDITEATKRVMRNPQQYNQMIDEMVSQIKPGAQKMQAGSALRQIAARLGQQDVDPNDAGNRGLVVTYYVLKTLLSRLNKPSTTDVRALLN